jgi:hypothetical protein
MGLSTSPFAFGAPPAAPKPRIPGVHVSKVVAEIRTVATTADGLPSDDVSSVAITTAGEIYAATARGLARFAGGKWSAVRELSAPVNLLSPIRGGVFAASGGKLWRVRRDRSEAIASLPSTNSPTELHSLAASNGNDANTVLLGTRSGVFQLAKTRFVPVEPLNELLGKDKEVRQVAIAGDGRIAVAAAAGLFLRESPGAWDRPNPVDGARSWLPRDVRGVTFDSKGDLWFASPAGVGRLREGKWSLHAGEDGLPYNDFTTATAGADGTAWFGTRIGAIRFDGKAWNYRQGRRWLPDDHVRAIALSPNGDAWFATAKGLGRIERRSTTLAEKAAFFEAMIDKYHRRTSYGYVGSVALSQPGDLNRTMQYDDDNDGLWTGMYGAGECFAYAATHNPLAKKRAKAAFEALRFLSQVTQGGEHPTAKGFPARSVRPTSDPDPNRPDQEEWDERQKQRDPLHKLISPRWPKSADGKWYWKCDTSSDELDGHYFLYACYYDLVAETAEEKQSARDVIAAVTDHLLEHNFNLIDHDGKPTRWARFGPETLNQLAWMEGRGLNSLSILSYLAVAAHATGEKRFRDAFQKLAHDQAYLANIVAAKIHAGPSTGNQSDDEMAFMCYFNLLRYGTDPEVRRAATISLRRYWSLEEPEHSPLFNFIFAASYDGIGRFERRAPTNCVSDGVDFLKRYPLDRCDWGFTNRHRLDVTLMTGFGGRRRLPRGEYRTRGVLPIDERFIEHWNYDSWTIDGNGSGRTLADGASFLLPYYIGRYFGFIIEDAPQTGATSKLSMGSVGR